MAGNAAAKFNYPQPLASTDTVIYFNHKDTVNVEWESYKENSTVTTLQIWWWAPTLPGEAWQPLHKYTVAQNGSLVYTLDDVKNNGAGYYLGQWNLNFSRTDRQPVRGLTLSQQFNVSFDDSAPARTWGLNQATPSPSAATVTNLSGQTATVTATPTGTNAISAESTSASSSAVPTAVASGLSGGAIAGVVIGVLAIVALCAVGGFFLWRKARRQQSGHRDGSNLIASVEPGTNTHFLGNAPPGDGAAAGAGMVKYGAQESSEKRGLISTAAAHERFGSESQASYPAPAQGSNNVVVYSELPAERMSRINNGTVHEKSAEPSNRHELPG